MPLIMFTPPAVVQAADLEDLGAPDIYADGWVMDFGIEVITGTSYVERIERGVIRRQVVVRVRYPRSRWMAAVNATLAGMRGGPVH